MCLSSCQKVLYSHSIYLITGRIDNPHYYKKTQKTKKKKYNLSWKNNQTQIKIECNRASLHD